ncbi:hypothetical protein [Gallaecimonas xiamenensis]|uniref:Uncharacterized protein n=1 Tax=Gallaecimonas xiamenensis 3-C-1 TaxID=745411 RepID=K2JLS8_9GAMM|nr:hypothetical protein [Gallaecimonas xiamenensis]EKE75377.1 hypothetical protein B3C1_06864 [Gallaecimonas xiamenensis 3-C-1]
MSRASTRLTLFAKDQMLYRLVLSTYLSALDIAQLTRQELARHPQASHAIVKDKFGRQFRLSKRSSNWSWFLLYLRLR